ncbi:hypothetical protein [Bacillus suaedae]|uniref:Uncharacterized protein n=1 Tax=Halalkalibacter suaedae TaxID=2822140 RepID=A0A940WTY4_9BACI|nr:hypothetical protein [Bacillus suaedae]MBP3950392.1 hypothetical protein [Bacillus suaedae]
MNYTNDARSYFVLPFFGGLTADEGEDMKSEHDTYDVYVENEFVGKKVLLTENDDINDVLDFVSSQGITDVKAHLNGDHYLIEANNEDIERTKKVISTYLENR